VRQNATNAINADLFSKQSAKKFINSQQNSLDQIKYLLTKTIVLPYTHLMCR
ncbi:12010_t:CDS:1, partial [Racocetra persica]